MEIVIPYGASGAGVPEQKYRDVLKLLYAMTDGRTAYQVSEAASAHRQAMKEMKSEHSDDPQEKKS